MNVLPSVITRIVIGARVSHPYHQRKDIAVIEDDQGKTTLSVKDFVEASEIALRIQKEYELSGVIAAHMVLKIRDRAFAILESRTDDRAGKKGILMLKDRGGC
jgi:hypothetical protein